MCDLNEEIYMEQPEGFSAPGQGKKVCKLVKSLYGLKQAPKQWHEKFDNAMLSMSVTNVYMVKTLTGVMLYCVYTLMTYSLLVVMMR